jgi:hypothetical protein
MDVEALDRHWTVAAIRHNSRQRHMWELRQRGWTYVRIAECYGVSVGRAWQIVHAADRRLARAGQIYDGPVCDELAYYVTHTYTQKGRVSRV